MAGIRIPENVIRRLKPSKWQQIQQQVERLSGQDPRKAAEERRRLLARLR